MPLIINKFPPDLSLEYLDMNDPEDDLWLKVAQEIIAKRTDHQAIPPSVLESRKSQGRSKSQMVITTHKGGPGSGPKGGHLGGHYENGKLVRGGSRKRGDGTPGFLPKSPRKSSKNSIASLMKKGLTADQAAIANDILTSMNALDVNFVYNPNIVFSHYGVVGELAGTYSRHKDTITMYPGGMDTLGNVMMHEIAHRNFMRFMNAKESGNAAAGKVYKKILSLLNNKDSDSMNSLIYEGRKISGYARLWWQKYIDSGRQFNVGIDAFEETICEISAYMYRGLGIKVSDDWKSYQSQIMTVVSTLKEAVVVTKGGPGSGFFGHAGGHIGPSGIERGGSRSSGELFTEEEMELFEKNKFDKWPVENGLLIRYNVDEVVHNPEQIKDYVVNELSQVSGLGYESVNKLVSGWAKTSNDTDLQALNLQEAAAKFRGEELSEWQKERKELIDGVRPIINDWVEADLDIVQATHDMDDRLQDQAKERKAKAERQLEDYVQNAYLRHQGEDDIMNLDYVPNRWKSEFEKEAWQKPQMDKFVSAVYTRTQNWLKASGYEPDDMITLYRGIWWDGPPHSKNVGYKGNVIESWSLTHKGARNFGNILLATRVRARDIFSIPLVGIGCPREEEVVIFGNAIKYVVARPRGGL
jgi:hypothetical protein